MSLPLGFLLAGIYKIFGDKNWYGIFILLSNLMFLLIIVQIINSYKNRAIRNTSIIVLGIVLPYLILNPTYTVTSILLSFSGLFLFLNTIKMENDKKSFYFLSGFALALGIAIRIDSLLGLIVFFGPFVVVYLL
jgi:hypothetical protein